MTQNDIIERTQTQLLTFSSSYSFMKQSSTRIPKQKTHRAKFTEVEDNLLRVFIAQHGTSNWQIIASKMQNRTPRQCRDRWKHYLAPTTNTRDWTEDEDSILIANYLTVGPHWGQLAMLFPGRTSVGVRNRCCKLLRDGRVPLQKSDRFMLPPITSIPFCPSP